MTSSETPEAVTRPEHCAMGFGIPTSETAFRERVERPPAAHSSFVSPFDGVVPYWSQVIYPYQRLAPRYKRLGVRVVEDLTLAGFSALFRGEGVRAVILFSHWGEDAIELSDGFADVPAVVEAVPESYDGYLDLIACHPQRLMPKLRHERPRCNLVWVTTEVTPVLWLIFYERLFQRLRRQPVLYDDAQEAELGERLCRAGRPSRERSA
jgi:hypothetical protein